MKKIKIKLKLLFAATSLLLINSCSLPQAVSYNVAHSLGERAPQYAPSIANTKRKIGRPYSIKNEHGQPIWYTPMNNSNGYREYGVASWYGRDFHAKKTANGEDYNMYAYTAAHKTLPLPTYVRVTNTQNGRSIIVRVNDRGPFYKKRLIDMSYAGAKALGFDEQGTAPVLVEAISIHGGDVKRSRFSPQKEIKYASSTNAGSSAKINRSNYVKPATSYNPAESFTTRMSNRDKITNSQPNTKSYNANNSKTQIVASTTGNYFIQLGSFTDINNARKLYYMVKQNINNAKITSVPINNTTFYRVVVEGLETELQANEALLKVKSYGFNNAIVATKK